MTQRQSKLTAWLTKEQIDTGSLSGSLAVIIDVLLSSTTILTILERGAKQVIPISSADEAKLIRSSRDSALITAGEFFGEKPEGFDFGPFPQDFSPSAVKGKNVAYLSTNGGPTISRAGGAGELLIGCIRNARAVSRYLDSSNSKDAYIVCSGNRGLMSMEDFVAASLIVSMVDPKKWKFDDAAILAQEFGKNLRRREDVLALLKTWRLGHWFLSRNRMEVLEFASDLEANSRLVRMKDGALVLQE